jgi:hypothetical protein
LDFIRKELDSAVLVGGGVGPVLLKLDDGLEAEGGGSDLRLEDPNEVGGGGFCKVDDDRLRGNWGVGLFTNMFGERGASKTLF